MRNSIRITCATLLLLCTSCWTLSDLAYYQNPEFKNNPKEGALVVLDLNIHLLAINGIKVVEQYLYLNQGTYELTLYFRDVQGWNTKPSNFKISVEIGKKYFLAWKLKGTDVAYTFSEMSELDKSSNAYKIMQKAVSKLENQ